MIHVVGYVEVRSVELATMPRLLKTNPVDYRSPRFDARCMTCSRGPRRK